MNIMQFLSVWLKITRASGMHDLGVRHFISMDSDGKGYLLVEEFVRGWTSLAVQGDGPTILKRCSSLTIGKPTTEPLSSPDIAIDANESSTEVQPTIVDVQPIIVNVQPIIDDMQPIIDDESPLPGFVVPLSHSCCSTSIQKAFLRRLYHNRLRTSAHRSIKNLKKIYWLRAKWRFSPTPISPILQS